MNRIHLLIMAIIACATLHAGGNIQFSNGTWDEIKSQSAKEKKYVFLDCYTDWCSWCKVMDREAFMDTSVTNFVNTNFIPTKREMEKDEEGKALSMKYHINGFPTYCIFSPEGHLVYKIIGYRKPAEFLAELKAALLTTTPLIPGLSTTLDPGYPQFYKESFGSGKKRKMPEQKVVTDFLDAQKDLFSEVSWSVMWRFQLNEKYENWIIDNRVKLAELYTAEEVDDKIISIFMARNNRAADKKDEKAFNENLAMMQKTFPDLAKQGYTMTMSQQYYRKTENWKSYAQITQSYADTVSNNNGDSFINGCAWTIYEECDDKAIIAQAIGWMNTICSRTEDYAFEDTYASLLYKDGQYKKAEEVALHAIDLGNKAGEDVSATESLLANIRLKIK